MMTANDLNVSRETFSHLETYAALLKTWSPKINLVSKASLGDLWTRHIADSAQVIEYAPHPVQHWADLGSGGGFPGLVTAIMAKDTGSPSHVTLVESDQRKAAFLRTVIRETGAPAKVITERIEQLAPLEADVVSARALADLRGLLEHAERHLTIQGVGLFPKGARWEKEVEDARSLWSFDLAVANSRTENGPVILRISGVSRV